MSRGLYITYVSSEIEPECQKAFRANGLSFRMKPNMMYSIHKKLLLKDFIFIIKKFRSKVILNLAIHKYNFFKSFDLWTFSKIKGQWNDYSQILIKRFNNRRSSMTGNIVERRGIKTQTGHRNTFPLYSIEYKCESNK